MKKQKIEIPDDVPGQGRRREQYEFAATILAGCFGGLIILVITMLILFLLQ